MDQQLKTKWLEALRSGKYQQGRGYLASPTFSPVSRCGTAHCCLGVLCEIDPQIEHVIEGPDDTGRHVFRYEGQDMTSLLNPSYESVMGFRVAHINVAMAMNDAGRPFSVIADYIEENF